MTVSRCAALSVGLRLATKHLLLGSEPIAMRISVATSPNRRATPSPETSATKLRTTLPQLDCLPRVVQLVYLPQAVTDGLA